jgi:hypothetical protein
VLAVPTCKCPSGLAVPVVCELLDSLAGSRFQSESTGLHGHATRVYACAPVEHTSFRRHPTWYIDII